MAENKAENKIELKSVSELLGMKFFIPSYQRGYRWTEQQVKDLLEDIWDFSKKKKQEYVFYCLQPLVVKRKNEDVLNSIKAATSIEEVEILLKGSWEVIDGQQRLTTLFIILSVLEEKSLYSIEYETRNDSKDFLKNIDESKKNENIDYYHIYQSKQTISSWFNNDEEKKAKFKNILLNSVKFIWYESVDEDPIKVFTRLNIGKISLTNAELIKALFLNRSNFGENDSEHLKLRQQEIASEWDKIEYTLQNDEFWLFLHEKGYDRPTRIDFIFDLICEQKPLGTFDNIGTDDYKTFRYFYEYFKSDSSNIEDCWKEVKKYFQTFKEWFDDLELYHYIGYLVEYKHSISGLVSEWHSSKDKDSFVSFLKAEIKKKIKGCPALDFQYKEDGSDKGKCKPILLFQNIQTIINQNKNNLSNEDYKLGVFYKFPFHLYKLENWDVEHINSNTTNDEEDADIQKEWLLNVYLSADDDTQKIIRSFFESSEDEKGKLFEKVKQIIPQNEEWTSAEKNRIWNYTLLDSSTNRSYGNAIFPGKRRVIIGKDKGLSIAIPKISKDGKLQLGEEQKAKSSFVPPCTKQVFMKYYSATMSDANYWTKIDSDGYLKDIDDCIKKLEE
ncbi:MAG: DUF262 domain-containing protein [Bacteroidales bacterium]|nr:DUF262 domain-containing protein [Bacteroidales bacterium]MBR6160864.1 DUF262 domain-containing protein [Bacteroidales bacterium]